MKFGRHIDGQIGKNKSNNKQANKGWTDYTHLLQHFWYKFPVDRYSDGATALQVPRWVFVSRKPFALFVSIKCHCNYFSFCPWCSSGLWVHLCPHLHLCHLYSESCAGGSAFKVIPEKKMQIGPPLQSHTSLGACFFWIWPYWIGWSFAKNVACHCHCKTCGLLKCLHFFVLCVESHW